LDKIAADKLEDMVENNYFAHTSPKGINPWFWFEKNKYDYKYAGENLAINFMRVEDQHEAWMKSPTHKKNILNSNYKEIGIAVGAGEINGQMGIITVQEFGTLASGAGVGSKEGENFSAQKDEGLQKDGVKITPQVLSVKDFTEEKLKNEIPSAKENSNWMKNMADKFNAMSPAIYNYMNLLAVALMFASMVLASASFLTVAVHDIFICDELRRKVYADHEIVAKHDRILISR
jgi:Fe2+ or Zn2+ uptake regulation protein